MNAAMHERERYNVDEVRLALLSMVTTVLTALGYPFKGTRRLQSPRCPMKLHSAGNEMGINPQKGLWKCYACGCGGDMLTLVAMSNGLDVKRDFFEVIAIAAGLVGVQPESGDTAEAQARREAVKRRADEVTREQELKAERDAQERAEAEAHAAPHWEQLPLHSAEGERYLASRGIVASSLQPGVVRFSWQGPCVALHSFDGEIVNVVPRRYPRLGDPKTPGRFNCRSEGTLTGSILEIGPRMDVVVCEGVIDSITAHLAWPHAVVLGAHAAHNLKAIAEHVAPLVRRNDGRMLLVTDVDSAGTRAGFDAARAARAAGLRLNRELELVEFGDAKDLNAAWQEGWRP